MKRLNFLPLFWGFILILITVLSFYSCANAQVVTISEILSNPDKYHLKTVLVKGEVLDVKHKVSKRGNPYTIFALSDGTSAIKIFTFGTPEINRGESRVKVKGEDIHFITKLMQ